MLFFYYVFRSQHDTQSHTHVTKDAYTFTFIARAQVSRLKKKKVIYIWMCTGRFCSGLDKKVPTEN